MAQPSVLSQICFFSCCIIYTVIGCTSSIDCSYLGKCDTTTSKCICNNGWYGTKCDQLNISSIINYQTDGYHSPINESTWDGSPIFDPIENKWHLFITILTSYCGVNNWLSNSIIAHTVSKSSNPIGPYILNDIALDYYNDTNDINTKWDAISVYNPMIIKDINFNETNLYYLFYTGTTAKNAIHLNCTGTTPPPHNNYTLRDNQAIGYATSKSLYGPWIRNPNNPILKSRSNNISLWDSAYVCNPSPAYLNNGSMILIYKGREKATENKSDSTMNTGIAMVDMSKSDYSWNGPYKRFDSYFNDAGDCEDGYFWEQIDENGDSSYHMEYHCKCNEAHAFSMDLLDWSYGEEQPWCDLKLSNGSMMDLKRRERPVIVFDGNDNVNAQYIFTAVQPQNDISFNLVQQL